MASNPEFVKFIAEQCSGGGNITYRKMFGEYGIYCDGKYFACVCDDNFFVKVTEAGQALVPDAVLAPPYDGAKPCLLIEDLDNRDLLAELVRQTVEHLK